MPTSGCSLASRRFCSQNMVFWFKGYAGLVAKTSWTLLHPIQNAASTSCQWIRPGAHFVVLSGWIFGIMKDLALKYCCWKYAPLCRLSFSHSFFLTLFCLGPTITWYIYSVITADRNIVSVHFMVFSIINTSRPWYCLDLWAGDITKSRCPLRKLIE